MNLATYLATFKSKPVTVYVIGGEREFAGTLLSVGDDYVEIDLGAPEPQTIVPFSAISGITHR